MNYTPNIRRQTPNQMRQRLQDSAVADLLSFHRLIVNWGTGVGKSRVAVRCAVALHGRGMSRILLLVEQSAQKENWRLQFVEDLGEEKGNALFSAITVECYASLPKYAGTTWDLIVADEAHHLRSDNRCALLASLKAEYMLCLSATISCQGDGEQLLETLNETFGEFKSIDFTAQNAIDSGILGTPRIFVHVLSLRKLAARQTIVVEWGPTRKRVPLRCSYMERDRFLNRDFFPAASVSIECTPAQAYEYYNKQLDVLKKEYKDLRKKMKLQPEDPDNRATTMAKNRLVRCGSNRKIVLGRAKTTFATALIRKLESDGRKFVCFCADVEQARQIGGDNVIYHQRHDNEKVIKDFNDGNIRSLFAVNMIQEGQNLAGIEAGVILQLGSKERQFIQKFGRTMRARYPEQHIVIINGSHDVDFYRNSVEGIKREYIKMFRY